MGQIQKAINTGLGAVAGATVLEKTGEHILETEEKKVSKQYEEVSKKHETEQKQYEKLQEKHEETTKTLNELEVPEKPDAKGKEEFDRRSHERGRKPDEYKYQEQKRYYAPGGEYDQQLEKYNEYQKLSKQSRSEEKQLGKAGYSLQAREKAMKALAEQQAALKESLGSSLSKIITAIKGRR